ncbi:diguanylate cyclase domain-containing protein [Dechloromonas sp. A34]|uniref:diguanylate cyclase domain-containing protein n=1 Tax=Dechloromonas sp. A34 TaxID=447588 RepID=UPI002B061CEA|nr:diguanylate cyclase [Dechloromonas sp. A34]
MTTSNTQNQMDLRHQAKERVAQQGLPMTTIDTDPQKLLLELQVHQIELSMQNEELRRTQENLEASKVIYFELYNLAPVGYCTLSETGRILQANQTAATLLGVAPQDLIEHPIRSFILKEEQDTFHCHTQELFATGELHSCDLRMVKADGTTFWVHLRSIGALDAEGKRLCRTAFIDITERKRAEEALREQKEFFHLIAENLSDFIAVLDVEGRRLYNSPSYEQFFGAPEDLRNTDSFAEIHSDDREYVRQVFYETVRTGQGQRIEFRFQMADGSVRDMESHGSVIKDKDGRVVRIVVVSHDITERKRLQEQVRQMAFHDVLTMLPNRRLFCDRLSQAIAASSRSNLFGALMFLDLDNFKVLNDTYGHDVGDLLLIEVADRLKRCVREMDTVARLGGDEFVVMLSQLDLENAESSAQAGTIAEKLRVALEQPFLLAVTDAANVQTTIEHRCTSSIGVTLFDQHEASPASALKRADLAMYLAKTAGGNQVRFFDAGDECGK